MNITAFCAKQKGYNILSQTKPIDKIRNFNPALSKASSNIVLNKNEAVTQAGKLPKP